MLNLNVYVGRAKFKETNRMRKVMCYGTTKWDAIANLRKLGYTAPIEITFTMPEKPSDDQLETCQDYNIPVPPDACKQDVSALIAAHFGDKSPPSEGLKEFATNHQIVFSSYIGKKLLYDKVFQGLDIEDKIAFFIFCVYRYLSDDRRSNLDTHPYRNIFYDFAREKVGSKRYINSLIKYEGRNLRFFGSLTFDDNMQHNYKGGRTDLLAYREAKQYLIDAGAIPPNAVDDKILPGTPDNKTVFVALENYNANALPEVITSSYEGLEQETENFINPYAVKTTIRNIVDKEASQSKKPKNDIVYNDSTKIKHPCLTIFIMFAVIIVICTLFKSKPLLYFLGTIGAIIAFFIAEEYDKEENNQR